MSLPAVWAGPLVRMLLYPVEFLVCACPEVDPMHA